MASIADSFRYVEKDLPPSPEGALLQRESVSIAEVSEIVHGTTLVTNAIIERRGAVTGLLTTAGFIDVLDMGQEKRYDVFDLRITFPPPIVPRALRPAKKWTLRPFPDLLHGPGRAGEDRRRQQRAAPWPTGQVAPSCPAHRFEPGLPASRA